MTVTQPDRSTPAPSGPGGNGVLVHEWISSLGGSEKVFQAMASALPDADLLCLWSDEPNLFGGRPAEQTWLSRSPLRRSKAAALPFMPLTWRRRAGDYDWALVSSHLFAHHVSFAGQGEQFRKYVYVHTPARYIWNPELDGRGSGPVARTVAASLKSLDRHRAQEAHALAANSEFVRSRIRRAWERDAVVIHPPVDVRRIQAQADWGSTLDPADAAALGRLPVEFVLGASRLVPYKRLDEVIRTAVAAGLPAVIAGSGPDESRLQAFAAAAGVPVYLLGRISDTLLYALYQRAVVYVFPPVEDFGIMPVEAMAAGARVVAQCLGGAGESVIDGVTGVLTDFRSTDDLRAAVSAAATMSGADAMARATVFDGDLFRGRLLDWLHPAAISAGDGVTR